VTRSAIVTAVCLHAGALALALGAAEQRFWLASQHDWEAKRGFYLNFECRQRDGEAACRLADVGLFLGVTDGIEWRFARAPTTWETGREYTVRADLGTAESALWVDGVQVATLAGGFRPAPGALLAAQVPDWAAAPATG
jgi:hypothetical protein